MFSITERIIRASRDTLRDTNVPDDKHVALIEQGTDTLNAWRAENPGEKLDFRDADLSGFKLKRANLTNANFHRADLSEAILGGADLRNTDFKSANLGAANLSNANLRNANLNEAILGRADLRGANLRAASLAGAKLYRADLSDADLNDADFRDANLKQADLSGANLNRVDFRSSNLRRADLSGAELKHSDLRNANLNEANLIDACLDNANVTDASFWEAQRDGWSIKGVVCARAFWARDRNEPIDYKPGEFERAFAEKLKIHLDYTEGMLPIDFAMLPLMLEKLQAEHPDTILHIRSVSDEGRGATVIIAVDDVGDQSRDSIINKMSQMQQELIYMKGQNDLLMPAYKEWIKMGKNNISIGNITGSVVIDGEQNIGSAHYTHGQLDEMRGHVQFLIENQREWIERISAENKVLFEDTLVSIKKEIDKSNPDDSIILAGVTSLKNMLESAAGSAIYGASLAALLGLVG